MYAYIARQPIFNVKKEVAAYELLYRDGVNGNRAVIQDGDQATRCLLSDAITLFGLSNLTNHHPAYVNFTESLIRDDFPYMADPKEVVVEILENTRIDQNLEEKLRKLREDGYTLALDDYVGGSQFEPILPLFQVIKVDFRQLDYEQRRQITRKLRTLNTTMLAEKVETLEDFQQALDWGYRLFQGYFFEKPQVLNKQVPALAATSYGRILRELQRPEVNLDACAHIVHSDALLTYLLMQKVHTLNFYRGNLISNIRYGLVMMGMNSLRRWIFLLLVRQNNVTHSDELPRQAYLRGLFIKGLIENSSCDLNSEDGFLLGMFSLLDKILGMDMVEALKELNISGELKDALLGAQTNEYGLFLQYALIYDMTNPNLICPDLPIELTDRQIARLYMKCIQATDEAFLSLEGGSRT